MEMGSFLASYKLINTCLKSEIFSKSFQNKKLIPFITAGTISWLLTTWLMRKYETQADEFSHINGHAAGLKSFMSKIDFVRILSDKCEEIERQIQNNPHTEYNNQYKKDLKFLKLIKGIVSTLEFLDEHPSCQNRIKKAEEYLNNQNLKEETA
jgi:Zn-dependent protease with chaperone function